METPEEHYVEETEEMAKESEEYEEKGERPKLTEEYKKRVRKFNEELMARKAPQPKPPVSEEASAEA